jgi:hypothetical protein
LREALLTGPEGLATRWRPSGEGGDCQYERRERGSEEDEEEHNKLAATGAKSAEGASVWKTYLSAWTAWNHVRTIAALLACASFILAFSE